MRRSARGGKTVYLNLCRIWWDRDDSNVIFIRISDEPVGFITTVNNKPGRLRYHPNLFGKLKKYLDAAGVVPPTGPGERGGV